jgi:hypothetical protein
MAKDPRRYLEWRSTRVPGAQLYQLPMRWAPRAAPGNSAPPAQPVSEDSTEPQPPSAAPGNSAPPAQPAQPDALRRRDEQGGASSDPLAGLRRHLLERMQLNPDGLPGQRKDDVWDRCKAQFDVSRRAFDRTWDSCVNETGATGWSKSGPRGSHKPKPRKPKPR